MNRRTLLTRLGLVAAAAALPLNTAFAKSTDVSDLKMLRDVVNDLGQTCLRDYCADETIPNRTGITFAWFEGKGLDALAARLGVSDSIDGVHGIVVHEDYQRTESGEYQITDEGQAIRNSKPYNLVALLDAAIARLES